MSKAKWTGKLLQYPLAIVCAAVFIAMLVAIFLRGGVVDSLSLTEDGLSERLEVIKTNQANAPGLKEQVEDLEVRVEGFHNLLFDPDQRAINTDFFYGLEQDAKVSIVEVSQTDSSDPATGKDGPRALKHHQVVVFNIGVQGSFSDIVDFCYQIYRVAPFVRITDFEIRGSRDAVNAKQNKLSARMRVVALALKREVKK